MWCILHFFVETPVLLIWKIQFTVNPVIKSDYTFLLVSSSFFFCKSWPERVWKSKGNWICSCIQKKMHTSLNRYISCPHPHRYTYNTLETGSHCPTYTFWDWHPHSLLSVYVFVRSPLINYTMTNWNIHLETCSHAPLLGASQKELRKRCYISALLLCMEDHFGDIVNNMQKQKWLIIHTVKRNGRPWDINIKWERTEVLLWERRALSEKK